MRKRVVRKYGNLNGFNNSRDASIKKEKAFLPLILEPVGSVDRAFVGISRWRR